jgi:hypothetical protein
MATKARRAGSLATILNANTSAASNTVLIDSGGDISLAGNLTVSSGVIGYATNAHLQATFAQNTYFQNVRAGALEVANANITFATKSTALASNNALIGLINDRLQVANADVKYVTKSVQLSSNNSLVNLINDRIQVANVDTTIATYWPSANVIAYTDTVISGTTKNVNTSIFIANGGENRVAIPYTNTNFMLVYLNGVLLTEDTDYVAANNVHIGNITPTLSTGDVLLVEEYKNHNTSTSSYGGGGAPFTFGGTTSGYASGGAPFPAPYNIIEKFSFTSDGNASDVGDLTVGRYNVAGQSSSSHGYTSGGISTPPYTNTDTIDKFPFASDDNATDVGDLTVARSATGITGQNSADNGYTSGGSTGPRSNIIDKFPFASDANAADVGDLTEARGQAAGSSSPTHGYNAGGNPPSDFTNIIDKFPFASDANAADVGDALQPLSGASGQSSSTHGYFTGGTSPDPVLTCQMCCIQKYAFASDGNSTGVGTLTECQYAAAGQSSTTNGYSSGGRQPGTPGFKNYIAKFPFASDANATDVGNLTAPRPSLAGQQV